MQNNVTATPQHKTQIDGNRVKVDFLSRQQGPVTVSIGGHKLVVTAEQSGQWLQLNPAPAQGLALMTDSP